MVAGFLISLAGIGLWHITDRNEKSSWIITAIYRAVMLAGIVISIIYIAT